MSELTSPPTAPAPAGDAHPDLLEVTDHGDVAVIRWADGENRFRRDSIDRWHALLDDLEARDGPLAVVVVGSGKYFSNGLDLDWFSAHPDEAAGVVDDVHRLFGRLLMFPAYTVVAISGHAFAGGAMLSCAADLRIMREDRGYWCLPEVDLGLSLTVPMYTVVAARLPHAAVSEAILTGRRYTGPDALAAGIVDEVAAEAAVLDRAVEAATAMAGKDRSVIAEHKRLMFGARADVFSSPGAPPAAPRSG